MRHNFNLIYNLYINFKFQKFLITFYIIIYKVFSKISQTPIYQYLAKIRDNIHITEGNKVLGYPLAIFDCYSGSGSYMP